MNIVYWEILEVVRSCTLHLHPLVPVSVSQSEQAPEQEFYVSSWFRKPQNSIDEVLQSQTLDFLRLFPKIKKKKIKK